MLVVSLIISSNFAYGYSHSYINTFRSSANSSIFVSQSLDGEYGNFTLTGKLDDEDLNEASPGDTISDRSLWRGIGLSTSVGLELMKFIQFSVGHTFINMRSQDDAREQLEGSRIHADTKLVFGSPIGNLEAGFGASIIRADYQKLLESSSFVGSGLFYSLGGNYFLTSRFSIFARGKIFKDHLMRNSGSARVQQIDTETTAVSLGFRIWM
ncbi:MAG: hypothetical protein R3B45_14845 [Bdellovibrionota bacterium]